MMLLMNMGTMVMAAKKNERVSLQVISILGGVFVEQSASAFGIFKFVQSLASAT